MWLQIFRRFGGKRGPRFSTLFAPFQRRTVNVLTLADYKYTLKLGSLITTPTPFVSPGTSKIGFV